MNDSVKIPGNKKQQISAAAASDASAYIQDKRPQPVMQEKQAAAQEQFATLPVQAVADMPGSYFKDNRPQAIVQRKQVNALAEQSQTSAIQKKTNNTGLPDTLKSGIENLSGHSMDDVKVHYNSSQPAQLNAHAYAQGTNIHIASGQERHLPHEAWHVVQQKQGRVKPTMQLKGKVGVNDDQGLEKEADVMAARSLQNNTMQAQSQTQPELIQKAATGTVQRVVAPGLPFYRVVRVNYGENEGMLVRILLPYTNPGNLEEKGYFTSEVATGFQRSYLYSQLDPVDEEVAPVEQEEEEAAPENKELEEQDPISALLAPEGGEWVRTGRRAVEYILLRTGYNIDSLRITTSGGLSLTIIPQEGESVYQLFPEDTFRHLQELEKLMKGGSDKLRSSIAAIQELVPSEHLAIMDKIVPLNVLFNLFEEDGVKPGQGAFRKFVRQNTNKLAWDISIAIHELAKAGIIQNDVSVDNIGIRNGQFVLFDFDKAKGGNDGSSDTESLFTSIHNRSGIPKEALGTLHDRILKHLKVIDEQGDDPRAAAFLKLQITGLP